jgi:PPIC-type PPIASE domain
MPKPAAFASRHSGLARMIRDPLFAFAVAGIALFGVYTLVPSRGAEPVRLTAATRAALIADFEALTGRPAGAEDVTRVERDYVTDELLFRDAVEAGLHLTDGEIRRQLVEKMRLRVTGLLPDPTDEQLVNHYAENLDRYRSEPAVSFEHVYFRRLPPDSANVFARLRRGDVIAGEPFPQGRTFPRYGRSIVRGMFRQPFVDALWAAPLGEWSGPLESPHGWHYVRPTERLPEALLAFDEVRSQVENDYLVAQIQQAVERRVAELEQRNEVIIER